MFLVSILFANKFVSTNPKPQRFFRVFAGVVDTDAFTDLDLFF